MAQVIVHHVTPTHKHVRPVTPRDDLAWSPRDPHWPDELVEVWSACIAAHSFYQQLETLERQNASYEAYSLNAYYMWRALEDRGRFVLDVLEAAEVGLARLADLSGPVGQNAPLPAAPVAQTAPAGSQPKGRKGAGA